MGGISGDRAPTPEVKTQSPLVTTAALPWRALMIIGGLLLAMMAGVTLWIAPVGGWFMTTAFVAGVGVVIALSGLVLTLVHRRTMSRGLEYDSRRAYFLPAMIAALVLAFLVSLAPLPLPSPWVSTFLFLILIAVAVWFAWQMIRTAAPSEYQHAQQVYQKGDLNAALALLDQVERDHPDDYGTFYLRALIYRQLGRYARAREAAERLQELRPDLYYGYAELGLALLAEDHSAQAREPLRRATEVAPGLPEGYFNLGMACAEAGDYQGAIQALGHALRLGLRDSVTRTMARYYLFTALRALGRQSEAEIERQRLRRSARLLRHWQRELHEGSLPAAERHKEQSLIADIERAIRREP